MKKLTREQVESRKRQAVRFVRDVVGDPDRADEIADESLEDYAARRKIQISNPSRKERIMAKRKSAPSYNDLVDRINELEGELEDVEEERDALAEQVEQIEEVLGVEEVEEVEEEDDDQD